MLRFPDEFAHDYSLSDGSRLVTDNYHSVIERKKELTEYEWERAYRLGKEYMKLRPGLAGSGRPGYSSIPAKLPSQ